MKYHSIIHQSIRKIITAFLISIISFSSIAEETSKWKETIKKATNSIVSIRVNAVRTFDTQGNTATQATGFVVDAKRGIILTNRHVVNPGPVTAEAIFSNSEEVALTPIYRDPVHDFGFFKYDPNALKFIQPVALKLVDNRAKIGDEIKVIGNDSGEHMSILSGTLARLDRSAPKYRRGGYNDFNTFYFQSAADTSGGSSGSPVINEKAEVLALNAGGRNGSSSSYFLPLFKVTRALQAIKNNQAIQRGTIQTTLDYQTYDEVRRLGLSSELEEKFRKHNKGDGVLTVEKTVLDGPADKKLRPGDIIISLQSGQSKLDYVSRYEQFEIFLDEHVGKEVLLKISRKDEQLEVPIVVGDLHQITPDEFIEIGGGVFNNFSYQLARQTNLAIKGVYIANPGFMFSNAGVRRGAVITQIDETTISNLDDFQTALSKLSQEQYFSVKYVRIGSPNNKLVGNVKFQTNWHSSNRCIRNDEAGLWPCKKLDWKNNNQLVSPTNIKFKNYSDRKISKISRSLVLVETDLPYHIDGQNFAHYTGTGMVIDADSGLVIVDRNTVPVKMAEVTITFAGVAQIPAKVLFVNPLHSYALIQYDPKLLKDSEIRSASLSDKPLSAGDSVWLVGYQTGNRLINEKLTVSSHDPLITPIPSVPRFRETNINSVIINNPPLVASGVLLDKKGTVRSWWTNFAFGGTGSQTLDRGLPISHIIKMRDQWLKNGKIDVYSLDVELTPISVAKARNVGLSDKWMDAFQKDTKLSQVLKIGKRVAGSDSFEKLKEGDLLLTVNSKLIKDFNDLDKQINARQLKVSVWRDGEQLDLDIQAAKLTDENTESIYIWAGALLQKTHRAVAAQYGIEAKGVYVSWFWYGSPSNRYGLKPLSRIIEVEGELVENLQQFIDLTKKYNDSDYLRIRLEDLIGRESIITLKQDKHYWPTQKISFDGKNWVNSQVN